MMVIQGVDSKQIQRYISNCYKYGERYFKKKKLILLSYIDKEDQNFLVKFFSKKTGTGQTKVDLANQDITGQGITDKMCQGLTNYR